MNITLQQAEKIIVAAKAKSIEIDTKMNIAVGWCMVRFFRYFD